MYVCMYSYTYVDSWIAYCEQNVNEATFHHYCELMIQDMYVVMYISFIRLLVRELWSGFFSL